MLDQSNSAFFSAGAHAATSDQSLALKLSQEEHQEIMAKLSSLAHLPAGHLEKTEELYLEQQLTDLLGFTVAAELADHRLNHSVGVMMAQPHLQRSPTDVLQAHGKYLEAGMAKYRSGFGWFTENGELTTQSIEREKYYFAVQLHYLTIWHQQAEELHAWYKYRKMVMINPSEETAVVGVVGDIGPSAWMQYQFAASPEVIRDGAVWSQKALGHVFLFFVDDPDGTIPLGPVSMRWQAKEVIV